MSVVGSIFGVWFRLQLAKKLELPIELTALSSGAFGEKAADVGARRGRH
jgi:hypothetical protein